MDDAIKILRRGDTDCQIRAAELSRCLGRWFKSYSLEFQTESQGLDQDQDLSQGKRPVRGRNRTSAFRREKHRTAQILAGICPTLNELRAKNAQKKQRDDQQGGGGQVAEAMASRTPPESKFGAEAPVQ